jgi:hypothetical protein
MIKELSFEELQTLFELNLDKKHVSDAIQIIKTSDCHFYPGIIMPQEHIASLYSLRYEIKKEGASLGQSSLGAEYLSDYEQTVANLTASSSESLGLAGLYCYANSFLIFFEPDTKKILGILKSRSNEHTKEMIEKPFAPEGFEKYSKGILVTGD